MFSGSPDFRRALTRAMKFDASSIDFIIPGGVSNLTMGANLRAALDNYVGAISHHKTYQP